MEPYFVIIFVWFFKLLVLIDSVFLGWFWYRGSHLGGGGVGYGGIGGGGGVLHVAPPLLLLRPSVASRICWAFLKHHNLWIVPHLGGFRLLHRLLGLGCCCNGCTDGLYLNFLQRRLRLDLYSTSGWTCTLQCLSLGF